MKILFLTQYFPPEIGAPQNRLYEMAVRLQKKNIEVTVLTAMPNYPQMKIHEGYGGWHSVEEMDGMKIHRCWIYVRKSSSIFFRLLNYFSFVFSSFIVSFRIKGKFDFIICESPPLFLGISGWLISRRKKAKFIFNVSDLWPESAEKLGLVTNKFFLRMATKLEEFLYRKSFFITGQTQGIVKNISSRFPEKKVHWLPNGVDLKMFSQQESKWRAVSHFKKDDFILLYAGIIGHAQGLEVILNAALRLKENPAVKFILLGSGPEKSKLLSIKKENNLKNVFLTDPVSKKLLPEIINAIDVIVVPLRRLELFKGAIPSKIFEGIASGKALLLGVEGEAKELFIDNGNCGLAFIPEDDADLAEKVKVLYNSPEMTKQFGKNGSEYVKKNFDRDQITEKFLKILNEENFS